MVRFWQVSLIIAACLIALSILIGSIGIGYLSDVGPDDYTHEEKMNSGKGITFFCTPVILIPGLVFLILGMVGWRRHERLKDVADVFKAYRRIRMDKLAEKMGTTPIHAEKLIMECIEDGKIEGHIDRRSGEFFTKDFLSQKANVIYSFRCPSCGAKNDSIVLPGEISVCEYCGTRLPPYVPMKQVSPTKYPEKLDRTNIK